MSGNAHLRSVAEEVAPESFAGGASGVACDLVGLDEQQEGLSAALGALSWGDFLARAGD